MKPLIVSASRILDAPAKVLYRIIADYQNGHASILPKPYFSSLEVEEGGYGEGTIIRYQMQVLGRTRTFRALITEPDPGCTLLETDLESNASTSFTVWSLGNINQARVTIMTVLKNRSFVEGLLAKILLTNVYRQELEMLAKIAKPSDQSVQAIHPNRHRQTKASK